MRVPDIIRKCVVFLGQRDVQNGVEALQLHGTGFIVGVPSEKLRETSFLHVVTAKHVVEGFGGRAFETRLNTRDGGFAVVSAPSDTRWWYHPREPQSVDVAVTPIELRSETDYIHVPPSLFLTDQMIVDRHIGPGDEVFVTGLFTKLEGNSRNIPIVRIGNVAMMPDEGDTVSFAKGDWEGDIEAYLIEARSIGGLSGSPVFVRETIESNIQVIQKQVPNSVPQQTIAHMAGEFHLLGLMHGHWEIHSRRKNNPKIISIPRNWEGAVNLGIAIVVPAKKILETINHPELVEKRRQWDERYAQSLGTTTPD
jgi:hypothetical protein